MLCIIFGVDEPRPSKLDGPANRPPEGEPVELPFAEVKRLLLAQLQDSSKCRKSTLKQLAYIHAEARHYDQALDYLRQLIPLELDLEQRAACVLAMGALAEKQEDFEAAVKFYRHALSMEPERSDVWFFIHNNLGYSLNRLGQFAEGEQFCRAAISINAARPNGHKNLGIALAGQGQHAEAAKSFVMATKVAPGDTRSLDLLKNLLRQHSALEDEFGPELSRCEQMVKFAAAAIQRARAGKVLKILLGCNNQDLDEMLADMFRCMTAGAVETTPVAEWGDFTNRACTGRFDLAFVIPNNLQTNEADLATTEPWALAVNTVKRIKGNSETAIIVSGDTGEMAGHGQDWLDAGADVAIELPFSYDVLADATRRVLTGNGM